MKNSVTSLLKDAREHRDTCRQEVEAATDRVAKLREALAANEAAQRDARARVRNAEVPETLVRAAVEAQVLGQLLGEADAALTGAQAALVAAEVAYRQAELTETLRQAADAERQAVPALLEAIGVVLTRARAMRQATRPAEDAARDPNYGTYHAPLGDPGWPQGIGGHVESIAASLVAGTIRKLNDAGYGSEAERLAGFLK